MKEYARKYQVTRESQRGLNVIEGVLRSQGYETVMGTESLSIFRGNRPVGRFHSDGVLIEQEYSGLIDVVEHDGQFELRERVFAFDYVDMPSEAVVTKETKGWEREAYAYEMEQADQLRKRLHKEGFRMREDLIYDPNIVQLDADGFVSCDGYVGRFASQGFSPYLVISHHNRLSTLLETARFSVEKPKVPPVDSLLWLGGSKKKKVQTPVGQKL